MKRTNMKRWLCLLLSLVMVLTVVPGAAYADTTGDGVAINGTNFPDAIFRGYVAGEFDRDGDGHLNDSEIANATVLNVNDLGITSLKGVEFFPNLYVLSCSSNRLTELDVSNNNALTYLYCDDNLLTGIDVSDNTALAVLHCYENDLTEVDVSNNTALISLFCGNNPISAIDLSNNSALQVFDCSYTSLTSLDVSNNTLLLELSCSGNQLSSLDLSSNTALERLICDENRLTGIDVSNNLALYEIYCSDNPLGSLDLSNNTALSYLVCCSNNLTELDLSRNLALTELLCFYNDLTALDVSNHTELFRLWCHYNPLETLDISGDDKLQYLGCCYAGLEYLDISTCPYLVDAYFNGVKRDMHDYYHYLLIRDGVGIADIEVDKSTSVITPLSRVAGSNRFLTAIEAADQLKKELDVEAFPNIVIASGTAFPDALAGAYLAIENDAPILLASAEFAPTVAEYAKDNLAEGGTVYILGGPAAVPAVMDAELQKQGITKLKRLAGSNRYETNIEILKEAGVTGKNLLICSGTGYADSLSASALDKPILLVGNSLTEEQKDFLTEVKNDMSGDFFVLGGEAAVSEAVYNEVEAYAKGTTERVAGNNRFETSVAIARRFLPINTESVVLAYAMNYPDGLSGGPVAYATGSPLLLVTDKLYSEAVAYAKQAGVKKVIIMGGDSLISDSVAIAMLI